MNSQNQILVEITPDDKINRSISRKQQQQMSMIMTKLANHKPGKGGR